MKKEKKKIKGKDLLFALIPTAAGAAAGVILAANMDSDAVVDETFGSFMLSVGVMLLAFYLAFIIQLIVHECGHLIFGLMTGYEFVSFRIGSLMVVKTKHGYQFRRMSIAGTGGQCLLMPPEIKDGSYPCVLYMLGGVLLNGIASILCVPLMVSGAGFFHDFALSMVITGAVLIVTNGVPLKTGGMPNDGHNALHLKGNKASMAAMNKQLSVNALQMEGLRLKEMPADLFEAGENADLKNMLVTTILVLKENRLMDEHRFDDALSLIERCLSEEMSVPGIYKAFLKMDRYYIQLRQDPSTADDTFLKEKDVMKVMRAMKKSPTVVRTRIVDAALKKKDETEKAKALAFFDKVTARYPAQGDVASEKDLIALALESSEGK